MLSKKIHTKSARDKLLNAAHILFYSEGIHETGIDAIVKRAGVAKKSLYNNFKSKDDLILAYLQVQHEEWLSFYRVREKQATTPKECIIAVFAAYIDHAEFAYEKGFRGCGLLNAAAEFPANAPERKMVCKQKEEVEKILISHLERIIPNNSEQIVSTARHISFLLEGSITRAGLEGNSIFLFQAQLMTKQLLERL